MKFEILVFWAPTLGSFRISPACFRVALFRVAGEGSSFFQPFLRRNMSCSYRYRDSFGASRCAAS